MTPRRKKLITGSVLLLGVGVVVVAGIMLYPSLRERYWIWKLESEVEEERLEAAERLGGLGSVRAIPSLIDAFELALVQYGKIWKVDRSTSRLYFDTTPLEEPGRGGADVRLVISGSGPFGPGGDPTSPSIEVLILPPAIRPGQRPPGPSTYVNAIRSILKSRPGRAEKLLRSYLTEEREILRAVAASMLFEGASGAREYVSEQRLAGDDPLDLLAPVESH